MSKAAGTSIQKGVGVGWGCWWVSEIKAILYSFANMFE